MSKKTWTKSLRKAIREWSNRCTARWPHIYRRLTVTEITSLCQRYRHRLTGPVSHLSVTGPGLYLPGWGGVKAVCRP